MSLRPSRDFTYVSTLALDVEVDLLCITAMKLLKNVMSCFYRTELENRAKRWPCEVSCERPLTNKLVQNHCFPCDSSHILSLKLDHFFGIVLNFDTSAAKRCNYTWKRTLRTWWVMTLCLSAIRHGDSDTLVSFQVCATSDDGTTCNMNNFVLPRWQVSQFKRLQSDSPHTSVRCEVHQKQIDQGEGIFFSLRGCSPWNITHWSICFYFKDNDL